MSSLLIRGAHVLAQPDEFTAYLRPDHDVLVRGGRIEAVQAAGTADPSHFDRVIDAHDRVVMPGLVNTHAHTPMVLFRGLAEDVPIAVWFNQYVWPLEKNLTARDVALGMRLGLAEMLAAGITTVNEHYFFMEEVAAAVVETGARAMLGWALFSSGGEAMIEQTADFAARWNGQADGRITTCMAPHAPYTCTDDTLRACAHKAHQLGIALHIHAAEDMQQTQASVDKRGQSPIEVLESVGVFDGPAILAHVCGARPEDIALMSRYTVGVAHCPKTYARLAMSAAPVAEFRKAGIAVGIGTDGVVSNSTLNGFEAMRLTAMLQKHQTGDAAVFPVAQALYTATRGGAAVLGMADRLGAVEPGFLADLLIVDLSGPHHQPVHNALANLVYNVEPADVRTVIVNGEVVIQEREHRTIDVAAVSAAIREAMPRLSRRDGGSIQDYNP